MSRSFDSSRFTLLDRPLRPDEAQQVSAAIRETPNILGYSPRELLCIPSCLVAETGSGEIAGICGLKRLSRKWSEIAFILVFSPYRKQGIGSALFRLACRRLESRETLSSASVGNPPFCGSWKKRECGTFRNGGCP